MEEIEEIKEFLGHIQSRVGKASFEEIWQTVLNLEEKIKQCGVQDL